MSKIFLCFAIVWKLILKLAFGVLNNEGRHIMQLLGIKFGDGFQDNHFCPVPNGTSKH